MLTLIVVNTVGNEEESIGVSRLNAYLSTRINHDVEQLYLYDYSNHEENLKKINKSTKYVGLDIYHDTADYVFKLARDIKKINKDIKIFVGSKFATLAYKEILEDCESIDFVVLGDGEYAIEEVIKRLDEGESINDITNVSVREDTSLKKPEYLDINSLPRPRRDEHILKRLYRVYLYTSTMCSGRCIFCATNLSKIMQFRPIDDIFDEIISIYNKYGINSFFFVDDSFEEPIGKIGKERLDSFCNKVLESGYKLSFTGQIKAKSFKREDIPLLKKMKKAGFYQLYVGIEAGNNHELNLYRKWATVEDNHEAFEIMNEAGLDMSFFGYILYGAYSTKEDFINNVEFLVKHNTWNTLLYLSKLRIYYNSDLYYKIKADGLLKDTYTYKSIFEYEFLDKEVEKMDKYMEPLYDKEFLDKMTSFFGYYMCYIAMKDVCEIKNHDIVNSINEATENIAHLNAEFFTSIYKQENNLNHEEFMKNIIWNIDNAFKHKNKLRKIVERSRINRMKEIAVKNDI